MPRKPRRKRRTREHIAADLAVNHVERLILNCGFSVERVIEDYGTDLVMYTYSDAGEIENLDVRLQVRARSGLTVLADNETISIPVDVQHLNHWLDEVSPFILVVYDMDVTDDTAYWLYVQRLFSQPAWKEKWAEHSAHSGTINLHLPRENRLDEDAIRRFRDCREEILHQAKGVIWHGEDD